MALYVVSIVNFICWAIGSQWWDWPKAAADTEWLERQVSIHDGLKGGQPVQRQTKNDKVAIVKARDNMGVNQKLGGVIGQEGVYFGNVQKQRSTRLEHWLDLGLKGQVKAQDYIQRPDMSGQNLACVGDRAGLTGLVIGPEWVFVWAKGRKVFWWIVPSNG